MIWCLVKSKVQNRQNQFMPMQVEIAPNGVTKGVANLEQQFNKSVRFCLTNLYRTLKFLFFRQSKKFLMITNELPNGITYGVPNPY